VNSFRDDLAAARNKRSLVVVSRSQVELVYHLLDLLPEHVRARYVDDAGVLWAEIT
jgi:hypothetical protein